MIPLPKKCIIGVIHLLPTQGYEGFGSFEEVLHKAFEDLHVLMQGGVDAIIIENNYDLPHKIVVDSQTGVFLARVVSELKKETNLPIGLSILWNDYKAALTLAKLYGCSFVRVPVFADHVKTDFGEIQGRPREVIDFRKSIGADEISIFVDIQVKHAILLNKRPIRDAAIEAISYGAEGVIVTGNWTGEAPLEQDLQEVEKVKNKDTMVIIGSGANKENITSLMSFADAVIVSTSLKNEENNDRTVERNIKSYNARYDLAKVMEFVEVVRRT